MATRPEASPAFQMLQNISDDWDYETGAEAGYDLNNFGERRTSSNAGPAGNIQEHLSPNQAGKIDMEVQEPDSIITPLQETALALEPRLIAEHPGNQSTEAGVTTDPRMQASIEQPRYSRQLSESDLDTLARIVGQPGREKNGDSPATEPTIPPLASPRLAGTQHDGAKSNTLMEASDGLQAGDGNTLVREQAAESIQPPLESSTVVSLVPDVPAEKAGKVTKTKKKKRDKPSTTSNGTTKLKKTKLAGNRTEGTDQQLEECRKDASAMDSKPEASAIVSIVPPKTPPEAVGNQDMSDWLEFTGYFDIENRRRLLKLFRRKKMIQEELAGIDSEINESSVGVVFAEQPSTPPAQQGDVLAPLASSALKRTRSPDPSTGADEGRAEKLRRIELANPVTIEPKRPQIPGYNARDPPGPRSPIRRPSSSYGGGYYDRQAPFDGGHQAARERERLSRSPVRSDWPPYHKPHEERRGSKNTYTRTWINPAATTSRKLSGSGSFSQPRSVIEKSAASLELHKGNCRYFMVKSWNGEHVLQSQKDGLWVTQQQSEALYADAFKACRHVIFFFSVNNSKAFQGYAKMDCVPGHAKPPTWTSTIKAPTSRAFRLKWITIRDTPFEETAELTNAMNEDMPVLVGRDGQEIDGECGRKLAELIDGGKER